MQEEGKNQDSMEGVDTTCNRYVLYAAVSLCRSLTNLDFTMRLLTLLYVYSVC